MVEREAEHNLIAGVSASLRRTPGVQRSAPWRSCVRRTGSWLPRSNAAGQLILSGSASGRRLIIATDVLDRGLPGVLGPVSPPVRSSRRGRSSADRRRRSDVGAATA
jgi:hypothetical protein